MLGTPRPQSSLGVSPAEGAAGSREAVGRLHGDPWAVRCIRRQAPGVGAGRMGSWDGLNERCEVGARCLSPLRMGWGGAGGTARLSSPMGVCGGCPLHRPVGSLPRC